MLYVYVCLSLLSCAHFSLFLGSTKWLVFQPKSYFQDSPLLGVATVESLTVSHHFTTCTVRGFTLTRFLFPQ